MHCWKALSLRIVRRPSKIVFIKGPLRKLHIKISAFTAHFPLKVQGSFKVLSSACSILWKYCIFAHNFCKLRQIHVKMLISVCLTIYLQRPQHQWTHTLKEPCLHLSFVHILPCKTFSKYGAHSQIHPGTNLSNIFLWKNDVQQNLRQVSMRTNNFQRTLHVELNTLKESCTFKGKCAVNGENFICN